MMVIMDIFIGILALLFPLMLLWAGWWIIKLLGIPLRYIVEHSYLIKTIKTHYWLLWIRELGDILMLIIICAIILFTLFSVGQLFTGETID